MTFHRILLASSFLLGTAIAALAQVPSTWVGSLGAKIAVPAPCGALTADFSISGCSVPVYSTFGY